MVIVVNGKAFLLRKELCWDSITRLRLVGLSMWQTYWVNWPIKFDTTCGTNQS